MATKKTKKVKALPLSAGLLYGPSRSQSVPVVTPSPKIQGTNIKVVSGTQAATGTTTIYTCPVGFRARVVYLQLTYSIGGGLGEAQVRDLAVMRLVAIDTVAATWTYETAQTIEAGQTIGVRASVAGTAFLIAHVIEESI